MMEAFLSNLTLQDLTASGLLGLTVLMFLVGYIVPRRTLTEAKLEADRWREAANIERESRTRLQDTLQDQSTEIAQLSLHSMEALRQIAKDNQTEDRARGTVARRGSSSPSRSTEEGSEVDTE